jgi:hypothetical protein
MISSHCHNTQYIITYLARKFKRKIKEKSKVWTLAQYLPVKLDRLHIEAEKNSNNNEENLNFLGQRRM